MNAIEVTVRVGGITLAAKQWGELTQPVILALHGWLDSAASFDAIAEALPEFCLIALDFAGHGFSDHRAPGTRYHMVDNVDDVIGFADALELNHFILIGHSMGAGIATLLAGAFPERVSALVLIDGVGLNTSQPEKAPELLRKAVTQQKKAGKSRKPVYVKEHEAIEARMQALGGISEAASFALCQRGLMVVDGGYTWRSDPRLKMSSAIRLTEDMMMAYIAELKTPTLVMMGKQSFVSKMPLVKERVDAIPDLTYKALDGNHHLHLEPETSAAVVKEIHAFLTLNA